MGGGKLDAFPLDGIGAFGAGGFIVGEGCKMPPLLLEIVGGVGTTLGTGAGTATGAALGTPSPLAESALIST